MRKKSILALVFLFAFMFVANASAQRSLYFGVEAGYSAQKPSLKDVEFNTDTTFLYGLKAGIKLMMIAVELNYFQAAHNLDLAALSNFEWGGRQIDYNFIGLNLKYFLSLILLQPYICFGYGYYTADIHDIDKDKDGGYNFGLGLELSLGGKLSLVAEGKYHHVNLNISERKLGLGNFTLWGGLNIYF